MAVRLSVKGLLIATFAVMQYHSVLQGLELLPLRPLYPSPSALLALATTSLLRPFPGSSRLTPRSSLTWVVSLATSPFALWYLLRSARAAIFSEARTYVELSLPKPDNPDMTSVAVAIQRKEDTTNTPGLDFYYDEAKDNLVWSTDTVQSKAKRDWGKFKRQVQFSASWLYSLIAGNPSRNPLILNWNSHYCGGVFDPSLDQPPEPDRKDEDTEGQLISINPPLTRHASNSSSPDTEPSLHAAPEGRAIPWEPQLRHDANGNLILGRSVGGNGKILYITKDKEGPMHHVTNLSGGILDMLEYGLANIITDILLLPLEALFVRSLAVAYLGRRGVTDDPKPALWLLRDGIYPVGSWFGVGLRGGRMMDYVTKMVLCFGMDMALSYGIWQVSAGVSWWVGKKFFRWGRL
ncbi:MAG: hypothetical protein Q9201_004990 [Fulgogasparrea decipioides]